MSQRIIIIDDDDDLAALLQELFEREGYSVELCDDGEQGLARALEERPDLVVLDIDLPLINGFRVCRLIKNTPATRHIPVVLISAYFHDAAHAERAREVGADGFVLKPFDPESLLHIARRLLC